VRRGSPTLGRFDSCAAPLQLSNKQRRERPSLRSLATVTGFANVLGFIALALLVVQILAPARGKLSGAPFRMTLLLRLHGPFGRAALVLAVAHYLLLVLDRPDRIDLLNLAGAPGRARAAVGAVIALSVLAAMSAWQRRGRQTPAWRTVHVLLSVAAVSLALGHVAGVARYLGLDAPRGIALSLVPLAALAALYLRDIARR
jgi:predicted ferric reductase